MYRFVYPIVLIWVGYELFRAMRSPMLATAWQIARGVRVVHFFANLPVQVATLLVAWVLLQVPGGSFGWWSAIGGRGSILMASSNTPSVGQQAVSALLLVLFVLAAPVLAYGEERVFRAGSEQRGRSARLRVAFGFGLIHAVMGIPLAAAVALTLPGLWFTGRYLAGYKAARTDQHGGAAARAVAVSAATRYHVAWNWSLAVIALATTIAGA